MFNKHIIDLPLEKARKELNECYCRYSDSRRPFDFDVLLLHSRIVDKHIERLIQTDVSTYEPITMNAITSHSRRKVQ